MADHVASPIARANVARNATRVWRRRIDWRGARESLWQLLDRHLRPGDRVAIVGAGNGDDLPLRRIARRAGSLDLLDLDPHALSIARRRLLLTGTPVETIVGDVTAGAADQVVARARAIAGAPHGPLELADPAAPLGRGGYDVVIGDLLYTQLVYPALTDTGIARSEVDRLVLRHGQRITDNVVARMHASAPGGLVVHLHDMLGWWPRHQQRFTMDEVLALPPEAALALASTGSLPYGSDPRAAAVRAGAELRDTALWRWNFGAGKQFLVCATVAASPA